MTAMSSWGMPGGGATEGAAGTQRRTLWATWRQTIGGTAAALAVAVALYFLPLTMGLPTSYENLMQHVWFESWDHDLFH